MSIESSHRKSERLDGGMRLVRRMLVPLLLFTGLVVAGCRAEAGDPRVFDDPEYEGMTREEMEMRAEPMTLEEAERLGIVDTTISIDAPAQPDSLIPDEGGLVPGPQTLPSEIAY
jgi:hypothetical protein